MADGCRCRLKNPLTCPAKEKEQCPSKEACEGICGITPAGPGLWCPTGPDEAEAPDELQPAASKKHPPARFVRDGPPVTHQHELGYTVIEETLVTQSYYLADGELIFTDFNDTIVPMPTGDYAVLGFTGEMVDCNNLSVPLDVLYNHHWLLKPIRGPTSHFNTPCPANSSQFGTAVDFTYVFGVGAESRRTSGRSATALQVERGPTSRGNRTNFRENARPDREFPIA